MRDTLPDRPWAKEAAIINLDTYSGVGTHWVCYRKNGSKVDYYDSLGNLRPPLELMRYFGPKAKIYYNYYRDQSPDSVICGHLCLLFLSRKRHL